MQAISKIDEAKIAEFAGLLGQFPRLSLIRGDMAAYNVLRHREPKLVSIVDGGHALEDWALDALVLKHNKESMGAVSYLVQTNQNKGGGRNQFARIDLVITNTRFREIGVGRALLMCVMFHLLRNWGDALYSISCLAAHEAISKILESIGFEGRAKEGVNYVHEEMKLEGQCAVDLIQDMAAHAASALKIVNYNLRQQGGAR